tara:strand:+ start:5239 stop:6471 length:1233 start_codon:yes stop_codon:yes gene_type:complete
MKILFLTLSRISSIDERGIYTDLLRKFRNKGHNLYIVSPTERRYGQRTKSKIENGVNILKVWTLNIQKTNIFEKAAGTILIDYQYLNAIKKHFNQIKFDLVMYSTPPITITKVISQIKKRDGAKTYLLLKDIFPQNAIDLGMMQKNSLIHKFFRNKEKILYSISDFIGCMSPANVDYLKTNNPQINPLIIEENPNSIDISKIIHKKTDCKEIREQYQIPLDTTIFVYGGNFGKPQGIRFLLKVIESNLNNSKVFFVLVGSGTEYYKINSWFEKNKPKNALLMQNLPNKEYNKLLKSCDIGMIFLDKRFSIPNFPSRLLSYLENKMPVITATDTVSDIGIIAQKNGFGFSVLNGDLESINRKIKKLSENKSQNKKMGQRGYDFMVKNFSTERSYNIIISHFSNESNPKKNV